MDLGDDLSLFILKIIGLITMFVDHYQVMIGGSEILRVIGRLSFPIFAFTLNEGYVHTRNLKKYLLRLFCFAVVIQGLFILCADGRDINIFFTLSVSKVSNRSSTSSSISIPAFFTALSQSLSI